MGIQYGQAELDLQAQPLSDPLWQQETQCANEWIAGTSYQQACGLFDCVIGQHPVTMDPQSGADKP